MLSSKTVKSILFLGAALLAGCSANGSGNSDMKQVGILQFAEHEALTNAREGFIEALKEDGFEEGKNVTFDVQNAGGDQSNLQTMSEKIATKKDLNFAIATPAAQSVAQSSKLPMVFTAVTDPVAAGLVRDVNKPDSNHTGTTDLTPVAKQIEKLLKIVPTAKKVGIFYNSSEVNSEVQAKSATEALQAAGVEAVVKTVTSTNEVQQVFSSLASDVDAVYFPTDTTVASTTAIINKILSSEKKVGLGGDAAVVNGMLVTYGVDYKEIGRQAGHQAAKVLNGTKVEDIPVEEPATAKVDINPEMAQTLGLDVAQLQELLKD